MPQTEALFIKRVNQIIIVNISVAVVAPAVVGVDMISNYLFFIELGETSSFITHPLWIFIQVGI